MRVKVDKSKIIESHNELNFSSLEYFKTVDEIVVYGLKITEEGSTYILLWNNGQHLIEVPAFFFTIIDNAVPSNWKIRIEHEKEISLLPELFYEEDFFENFAEWESKEREAFLNIEHLF